MVTTDTTASPAPARRRALFGLGVLLVLELAAIGSIFKHSIAFTCLDNWPKQACTGASSALVAVYCMLAAAVLFAMLSPGPLRRLTGQSPRWFWPLAINLVGVAVCLLPVLFLKNGGGTAIILPAFVCWGIGMALLLGGLALALAPLARWRSFLAGHGLTLLPMLAAAAAAPWFATQIRPLWQLETIANITFQAVAFVVRLLGYTLETIDGTKVIGAKGFYVNVAPQCSGVEGFALVTIFVTLYLSLFRRDLRFPRALWLYPIGLAASAVFNVLRIAALLIIGLEGNPELAVGGFHSHAGWLMFTLVALGIIALARNIPALGPSEGHVHRAHTPPLPLLRDPVAARILPFAIFMLSALLAQVFATSPGVVYPLRALVMAAVLALFWPVLRGLLWRIDPVAAGAGLVVGLMWVLIPVASDAAAPPYGTLSGALLLGWFVLRGLGTVMLVPVIEELFFRDYLESRLRRGPGLRWQLAAACGTAVLFAALHDRWAEAFVAGLVFSYVMQRKGQAGDAIIAHGVANLTVFSVAVATGNLAMI